jgi:hypothetical protein
MRKMGRGLAFAKWWIRPLLFAVLGLGVLILLTQGKTFIGFSYTVF